MKRSRTKRYVYPAIGSISEGTLRNEDLIETFAGELRHYMRRMRLGREQRWRFNVTLKRAASWQDAAHEYGDQDFPPLAHHERGSEIVTELEDALNELAAPYTYFGTAEGDGACFGFWPIVDDDDLPKLTAGDPIPREHWGEDLLLVNDHGNVECGHVDLRGRFHEYWSCV